MKKGAKINLKIVFSAIVLGTAPFLTSPSCFKLSPVQEKVNQNYQLIDKELKRQEIKNDLLDIIKQMNETLKIYQAGQIYQTKQIYQIENTYKEEKVYPVVVDNYPECLLIVK